MPNVTSLKDKRRFSPGRSLSSEECTESSMTSNSDCSSKATVEVVPTRSNWITRRFKGDGRPSSIFRPKSDDCMDINTKHSKKSDSSSKSAPKRKSSVSFATYENSVNTSDTTREGVVVAVRPELTEQEVRDLYWTKKEISLMLKRTQKMAKAAFKADSQNILACFYTCYGIDQNAYASKSDLIKKITSSSQHALNYLYRYQAVDSIDIGDKSCQSQLDSSWVHSVDHQLFEAAEEPPSSSVISTLRGLERQLSIEIVDYRLQCIHAVLNAQAEIRSSIARGEKISSEQVAASLCQTSSKSSMHSRRFARLLGKADAAVIGITSGKLRDEELSGESIGLSRLSIESQGSWF